MLLENRVRVFDVTQLETDWMKRDSWVQATFWILTKDMIRDVRFLP